MHKMVGPGVDLLLFSSIRNWGPQRAGFMLVLSLMT
jgi:hypothetical protein